jgi:hypothetical protein
MTASNLGSSAVRVGCWMSTISPISSVLLGKPASMILSAVRVSPTLASEASRYFAPTALPMKTDAVTNASQPMTAVFQWLELQRPMRAARLLDRNDARPFPSGGPASGGRVGSGSC